jgi:hypothetical protein
MSLAVYSYYALIFGESYNLGLMQSRDYNKLIILEAWGRGREEVQLVLILDLGARWG